MWGEGEGRGGIGPGVCFTLKNKTTQTTQFKWKALTGENRKKLMEKELILLHK